MSTVLFRRPARRNGPELPQGDLSLQEPPAMPDASGGGLRSALLYLPMALMSGVMVLLFAGSSRGPTTWLMAGLMAAATGGMTVGQLVNGDRKRRVGGDRRDYLRHLAQHRRKARASVGQQRAAVAWRHPDPAGLWSVAMTGRRWERRTSHPDFAELRAGTGEQRLAVRITPVRTKPVEDLEPLAARSLRRFIRAYTTLPDQPVAVYLRGFARVRVSGYPEATRGLVRALLAQLVTFHAPEELRVAGLGLPAAHWDWLKWLPHGQHPTDQDGAGPVRLHADTVEEVERLTGIGERERFDPEATPTQDEPYVVVLLEGVQPPATSRPAQGGYRNAVLIEVVTDADGGADIGPDWGTLCLDVSRREDAAAARTPRENVFELAMLGKDRLGRTTRTVLGAPDRLGLAQVSALARVLAPWRLGGAGEVAPDAFAADVDLAALIGLKDLHRLDPAATQRARGGDRLRVPIGVAPDGSPVELDLKESALGGMGPHGMLIGATGSGKSELLRTIVLGLALTHPSQTLNMVLVDFKGGATFLGLDRLPHTSALITNLADEAAMVARMQDALRGELLRRQELLRRAGGYSSALDYERARTEGAALDPLPTLFVVVDEFSELLAAHRDFIDLFVMIGRLGRSLGVHLLLASQRLDDGRIGQLESHLSYRIGLRTFSAVESRSVIGVPDAYELPAAPGNGFLRTDVATLVRFKAAYVSGPHRRTERVEQHVVRRQVVPFVSAAVPGAAAVEPAPQRSMASVLHLAVDRLAEHGAPAHQVWLPPLAQPPSLDQLMPPLVADPLRGLTSAPGGASGLAVAVGFVDRPAAQLRDLLVVDLAGTGGHVGIAGGPQAGKSTLLRSLICALALSHTPREVQFYCLDFGGGTLAGLAGLPHVGTVCGRLDTDRVGRVVAEITNLVDERERRFAELGVDSMRTYRQLRAGGGVDDDPYGDVFLVVDGWFTLRQDFEPLEAATRQLAARGLHFGVHLLLTAARWSEVHHGMRDQIGTRLELRLGDPVDSSIDMRLAATVPQLPGRGLTTDRLHFLAALPRIDGLGDPAGAADALRHLVETAAEHWTGPRAPAVRVLPTRLPVADLPEPEGDLRIAIGHDEERLEPVWLRLDDSPHVTVLGDAQSGKTNLLRLVARAVMRRFTPLEARILVVDYQRVLIEDVAPPYRVGAAFTADTARAAIADAVAGLQPRVPGADLTAERLRTRDWWTGPRLFVLVDDYEMLAGHDSPLLPLLGLLPQGGDIGLHLVLARGAGGAGRMAMDPVIRRLQETNSPDLVLSCPPGDGPLLGGAKPRRLPPGRALWCTRRGSSLLQTGDCTVSPR